MEINTSQVGQNFAVPSVDINQDIQQSKNAEQESQQASNIKDLSVSAEIEIQDNVQIEQGQIEAAVSQISEFVQANNRQLNFSVDESSKKQIVKVTDTESGEIIRQIPSEEVLKLSERLQDLQTEVGTAVGLLFNKQA